TKTPTDMLIQRRTELPVQRRHHPKFIGIVVETCQRPQIFWKTFFATAVFQGKIRAPYLDYAAGVIRMHEAQAVTAPRKRLQSSQLQTHLIDPSRLMSRAQT